ncbi:hypothetical protein BH18ACI5_BH18ACI5_03660 [soil metagenome]
MLGVTHGGADLGKLLDRVANLLVENLAVGDDDDRIEDGRIVFFQANHLVREPGNGVGLAASG